MAANFDTRLAGYHSPVLSVFRIMFGLLYMLHGAMKLFGWPLDTKAPVGAWPFWWAGIVEFVLGLLITVGLFTRIAAFIASGEMAVAYFYQHWPPLDGPAAPFWPYDPGIGGNGGEAAILYCFAFLLLATTGAGALSADARRRPGVGRRGATAGGVVTGRAAPRARGGLLSRFRRR